MAIMTDADLPRADEPLWIRCARQIWGDRGWRTEIGRYFGKSAKWANHLAKGRIKEPPDLLDFMRELLVHDHQQSILLISEIDETKPRL